MQTEVSSANTPSRAVGYVPIDPRKKAPLHWTEERKRRVLWKHASLLILAALIAGFLAGQMLPQVVG